MLVVERVVGIGCEVDEGAGDYEDLLVVVRLSGQQGGPVDDCPRIAGSALPAEVLTDIGEGQRPVEDGGVRLFGVEAVEKSFEVLVTDLDETRPVPGVTAEGVDCSFEDLLVAVGLSEGVVHRFLIEVAYRVVEEL